MKLPSVRGVCRGRVAPVWCVLVTLAGCSALLGPGSGPALEALSARVSEVAEDTAGLLAQIRAVASDPALDEVARLARLEALRAEVSALLRGEVAAVASAVRETAEEVRANSERLAGGLATAAGRAAEGSPVGAVLALLGTVGSLLYGGRRLRSGMVAQVNAERDASRVSLGLVDGPGAGGASGLVEALAEALAAGRTPEGAREAGAPGGAASAREGPMMTTSPLPGPVPPKSSLASLLESLG